MKEIKFPKSLRKHRRKCIIMSMVSLLCVTIASVSILVLLFGLLALNDILFLSSLIITMISLKIGYKSADLPLDYWCSNLEEWERVKRELFIEENTKWVL